MVSHGSSKKSFEQAKKLTLEPIIPQPMIWFEHDTKRIRLALFDEAAGIADKILCDLVEGRKAFSSTQMRRYYNEVKSLDYRIKSWRTLPMTEQRARFTEILPLIKFIRAKVEYKRNARVGRVPKSFAQFMADCIDSVNTMEEFKAFVLFFEAMVAFYIGRNERS